jgi:hypothetical protein
MRHPRAGARLLAKTLASAINDEEWITDELKFKFCAMFVDNLMDGEIERSVDKKILEKIKGQTFQEGLRLMRKRPETGLRYMLAIVMEELRHHQGFGEEEHKAFYEELLANFFPQFKVSDFME